MEPPAGWPPHPEMDDQSVEGRWGVGALLQRRRWGGVYIIIYNGSLSYDP